MGDVGLQELQLDFAIFAQIPHHEVVDFFLRVEVSIHYSHRLVAKNLCGCVKERQLSHIAAMRNLVLFQGWRLLCLIAKLDL